MHADFNRYTQYDLRRRVNTFIFLNEDWPESHGGHLGTVCFGFEAP